jgi:hypothetical protein
MSLIVEAAPVGSAVALCHLEDLMFRLVKLAAFMFFGYALYEFFRGLSGDTGRSAGMPRTQFSSNNPSRSEREDQPRQSMTGNTPPEKIHTQETSGGSSSHAVGRGVVPQ